MPVKEISACLSVCLSVYLSVCQPACLFVCLSICLSVCLPACLPVCVSVLSFWPNLYVYIYIYTHSRKLVIQNFSYPNISVNQTLFKTTPKTVQAGFNQKEQQLLNGHKHYQLTNVAALQQFSSWNTRS